MFYYLVQIDLEKVFLKPSIGDIFNLQLANPIIVRTRHISNIPNKKYWDNYVRTNLQKSGA